MRVVAGRIRRWGLGAAAVVSAALLANCGGSTAGTTDVTGSPSPAASSAAPSYARDAGRVLESLAIACTAVAESMAVADPASDAWRSTVRSRLKALADAETSAAALKPGPGEQDVHQQLLSVTSDVRRASDLIGASLDPVDADRLQQAAQLLGDSVTRTAALRLRLRTP